MAFLRNLLASILGSLVAFGILFLMFLIFVSIAGAEEQVRIANNSVLELKFTRPVAEYATSDQEDPFAIFDEPTTGLNEITKAIALAAKDDRISGISLGGPYLVAGMSQTRSIRNAIADFKATGKFVYAYSDFYLQKDYYLSSVADSIFINPVGDLDFKGLAAEVLYFGDFQEQTGLKMEVVRHGKYKSAVEPFLSDTMSDENRSQLESLLESIWGQMRSEIAEGRNMSEADLDDIANGLLARSPEKAWSYGLIDGIMYRDEYDAKLLAATGSDKESPSLVSLQDYIKASRNKKVYTGEDRIAVIYAQGEILYGEGNQDYIGQGMMVSALKKARENDKVKAVVLRINSPGGSALSSEIIWREIRRTQEEKPVVVSLSDVAASGGYYLAVGADHILTEPTSITGSIGVFLTIPNIEGLSDKVGINAEQVGTHEYALDYSVFEPMREDFREILSEGVEETYQTFLERVAEGRGITVEQANELAQGRVWSGVQAVEIGLADELGGLPEALEKAAELAEIEDFRLQELPRYKTGLERFLEDMSASSQVNSSEIIEQELGSEWAGIFQSLKASLKREGMQTRLPFELKIR